MEDETRRDEEDGRRGAPVAGAGAFAYVDVARNSRHLVPSRRLCALGVLKLIKWRVRLHPQQRLADILSLRDDVPGFSGGRVGVLQF